MTQPTVPGYDLSNVMLVTDAFERLGEARALSYTDGPQCVVIACVRGQTRTFIRDLASHRYLTNDSEITLATIRDGHITLVAPRVDN